MHNKIFKPFNSSLIQNNKLNQLSNNFKNQISTLSIYPQLPTPKINLQYKNYSNILSI